MLAAFDCGVGAGVGTAIARACGELSDDALSSSLGVGDFLGFGVSSSCCAVLVFPVFFDLPEASFSWDFFFAVFGLGVGV